MGKLKTASKAVFYAGVVVGISYCTYNFTTAESRLRAICAEIQPGMSVAELREYADEQGLGPPPKESGVSFIVEGKSVGRWGCEIATESGYVKDAKYIFHD